MFAKRNKDPWKKYSCQDKNEEEKLQDLYNAIRDSRADVINVLVTKGGINVNGVHPEESKGQGYVVFPFFENPIPDFLTLVYILVYIAHSGSLDNL